MNWVEQRAATERALREQAPELWNAVRAAIQDACQSFNQNYADKLRTVIECKMENGARIRVTRKHIAYGRFELLVSYDHELRIIEAVTDSRALEFYVVANNRDGVHIIDNEKDPVSPEQISERLLGPMMFPNEYKNEDLIA